MTSTNTTTITIKGDSKSAERSLDRVAKKGKGMGKALKDARGPLLAVGAAFTLAGGASVKAFVGFDKTMATITGLVGIAADEVEAMKKQVLGLAKETARGPQELAEALFTVTSAGLRGGDAMDVLRSSARAASSGMGETKDVALTLVGALQSYKATGLEAGQATDILTATVRAGNLAADSLASALPRILPVAAAAGVSLGDLGGSIALVTRTGAKVPEVVTGARQAILAMSAPTMEAAKALEDAGIGADDLRKTLREGGLVAGLQAVEKAAGGDASMMRRMLGSVEALNFSTVVLSASEEDLASTFGAVANAAGVANEAFDVAADTAGFKFDQAMVSLKVTMIDLGDNIGPPLAILAGGMAKVVGVFSDLPGPLQAIIAGAGAFTVGVTALAFVLPALIAGFVAMKAAVIAANVAMMANPFTAIAVGLSMLAVVLIPLVIKHWDTLVEVFRVGVNFMLKLWQGYINFHIIGINKIIDGINLVGRVFGKTIPNIKELNFQWTKSNEGVVDSLDAMGLAVEHGEEAWINSTENMRYEAEQLARKMALTEEHISDTLQAMGARVLMTEDSFSIAFAGMSHTAKEFAVIQQQIEDGMMAETQEWAQDMISSRDAMASEFIDSIQREADALKDIRQDAYDADLQAQKDAMAEAIGYEEDKVAGIAAANETYEQMQADHQADQKAWFDEQMQMIEDTAAAEAKAQKDKLARIAAEAKAKQDAFDDERRRLDAFKAPSAVFREDFANILAQTLKAQQEGGDVSAGMVELLLREFKKMGVGTSGVIAGDARVNTAEGVVDFRTFFEQVTGQALVGNAFNIESLFHALTDEEKHRIFQNLGLGMYGFAQGGIVPGPIGQPQMAVVHGGEQVLPAGRRSGGITVEFVNKGTIIGVKDWERFLADGIRTATRRGLLV